MRLAYIMLVWEVSGSNLFQETRYFDYIIRGAQIPGASSPQRSHFFTVALEWSQMHNIGIEFRENRSVFKGDSCRELADLVSVRFLF